MTTDAVSALRRDLWSNGFRPVAVYNAVTGDDKSGKRPVGDDWRALGLQNPPAAVSAPASAAHLNTGILCDGLRAIDIDIDDPAIASDIRTMAELAFGDTIARTRSTGGRCLLLYRAAEGEPRKRVLKSAAGKVEFLGAGQQFVAFGGHHTGAALEWPAGGPDTRTRDSLPAITEEQVTALCLTLAEMLGAEPPKVEESSSAPAPSSQGATADALDIMAALSVIPNDGPADWEHWNRVGMAVWRATSGSATGYAAWCAWSERHPDHDAEACEERWSHFWKSPPTAIGAGSLFHMAKQARADWRKPTEAAQDRDPADEFTELPPLPVSARPAAALASTPVGGGDGQASELSVNEQTEDAVARGFAHDMQGTVAYDHSSLCWYVFDKTRGAWRRDMTGRGFATVREYCTAARALFGGTDKAMAGASFFANVERLARFDPRLACDASTWDTNPWLLGVPGGVVDLKTGELLPPDPAHRITKQTLVAPAPPGTPAPLWDAFLLHATGGDLEFMAFLYRLAGYCLSGDVSEEIIAFAYGLAGTGKGTFWGALMRMLLDYAIQTSTQTFESGSKINSEYARASFRGARLVMASETERGTLWNESTLKELSGNEGPIPAREPHGKPFTYTATYKIVITGNTAPLLKGYSDSMERRLRVMPFKHKPAKVDGTLKERLIAEYPQILRRFIDGCLAWQRDGLGTCDAVAKASRAYFAEQDTVSAWAGERLDFGADLRETRADLFADFSSWAKVNGETVPKSGEFYESLRQAFGLSDFGIKGVRHMRGAAMRKEADETANGFPVVENSDIAALIH